MIYFLFYFILFFIYLFIYLFIIIIIFFFGGGGGVILGHIASLGDFFMAAVGCVLYTDSWRMNDYLLQMTKIFRFHLPKK